MWRPSAHLFIVAGFRVMPMIPLGLCSYLMNVYYINMCCIFGFPNVICSDLRVKVLVACKVTPAIWLNLSDSRNILIIHFGLLLKERTLDSIGHDLLKKYNVICMLWMIRYISLLTNIFTQWILIDA